MSGSPRSSARNPRAYPPRNDPRRPRGADDSNPLFAQIAAAVDQFGSSSTRTRSRRHGHEPAARGHVEAYLLRSVAGIPVKAIAAARHRHRSTVYEAIDRGRRLVHQGAAARGFDSPDGRHFEQDLDDDRGWSNPGGD